MDPHSVAIDQDIAFGFEAAAELPVYQAPTALSEQTFDAAAPDIELCRLAAGAVILRRLRLIYERYHRSTYSLCYG